MLMLQLNEPRPEMRSAAFARKLRGHTWALDPSTEGTGPGEAVESLMSSGMGTTPEKVSLALHSALSPPSSICKLLFPPFPPLPLFLGSIFFLSSPSYQRFIFCVKPLLAVERFGFVFVCVCVCVCV